MAVQPTNSGASFQRFTLRRGSALAVASVSAWVRLEKDTIAEARIVMGAVGPVPLFAPGAASFCRQSRRRAGRGGQIVDVGIGIETPLIANNVVDDTGELRRLESNSQ